MADRLTFKRVVLETYDNAEIMAEYRRLTGSVLGLPTTPLESMIDHATGRFEGEALAFIDFVFDAVWSRLPPESRDDREVPDVG